MTSGPPKTVQPVRSCHLRQPPSIKKQWHEAKKSKTITPRGILSQKKLIFV